VSYFGYDAVDRLSWVRADAFGVDAATYYAHDPAANRTGTDDAEGHCVIEGDDDTPNVPVVTGPKNEECRPDPESIVTAPRHRAGGISLTPRSTRRILALVAAPDRGW